MWSDWPRRPRSGNGFLSSKYIYIYIYIYMLNFILKLQEIGCSEREITIFYTVRSNWEWELLFQSKKELFRVKMPFFCVAMSLKRLREHFSRLRPKVETAKRPREAFSRTSRHRNRRHFDSEKFYLRPRKSNSHSQFHLTV